MELALNDSNITVTTGTEQINQILEVDSFLMLLLILSICCNLLLLAGIIWRKTMCFIPWMIFYGLELFSCWMSGFFLLFGKHLYLSIYVKINQSLSSQLYHCYIISYHRWFHKSWHGFADAWSTFNMDMGIWGTKTL